MLGAIIGDIVGSRHEFFRTNDYNFEFFTRKCFFTDDTVCTFGVADSLLHGKPYGEMIHKWCKRYPDRGYGSRFRQWVYSNDPQPYGSFGNGSAMRVSPVGWWFDTPEEVMEEAKKSAECSHDHPWGIIGAQAVAIAIHDCRKLRKEYGDRPIPREEIRSKGLRRAIELYEPDYTKFNLNLEDYRNIFDETCQGTVPPALQIILESDGFEDTVRRAVSLGADADTIGAIAGSIAEALWGIPGEMKMMAMTYLDPEMIDVLDEFHEKVNERK